MMFTSINPTTEACIEQVAAFDSPRIEQALAAAQGAGVLWAETPLAERTRLLVSVAERLRTQQETLATLITTEMGKLRTEALAEINKCAWVCDYYAEHAEGMLADELIDTDAARSLVAYQPLGVWLAIMPWNFPFWQVFRCAAPVLAAGNPVLLKHASNVPGCALAIERLFREAGAPAGLFQTLLIAGNQAEVLVSDARIRGVSLTGSEAAGRRVAAAAGASIKPSILELGGSDAFVVLADADVEQAATVAAKARFLNGGQSCIAAKRFILVPESADAFLAAFKAAAEALIPGDPLLPETTLPPLARSDLRDQLHAQVQASIAKGARLVTGGASLERPGWFYAPTVLDACAPGMPAYHEELFGPVAAIIRARDEADALRLANDSDFGLGGSVWSQDRARGEALARRMQCGCAFVNDMVKSDPRLPFGGIKNSGYGRELGLLGIRSFCNAKTLCIQ
ncbi:NAD-dependent succinate-semialdehyde dehydrogenase [Thiorhodovibrio litoralis]|uniref:NAD-dependent succinate-semialdehyde dehydrogenase n=3 Tax=Thiorhodovibrio TaxID=61593 RepID=UPI002B2615A5|nr:NAD-dependent succinate-semialdehyde dehydrogenase [Thiorhodovibrio litoralis]WPL12010.1 Succinate semialdehyde dehydrogenase [NAD(P)+] Sad [Thiorhodovibrio litoralis]